MKTRALLSSLCALCCVVALQHACGGGTKPAGGSDAGQDAGDAGPSDAGDAGNGSDAGDAGSADAGCTNDDACGSTRYCEKSTGICRDGKICPQGQGNCDYQGPVHDYCDNQQCYCDPGAGVCKPLHLPCTPCDFSAQCGNVGSFDYESDCVGSDAGFADASVCIPRKDSFAGCPPGFSTPQSGVYCPPAGGHCGAGGACASDSQCDPHGSTPICNPQLGLCVAACTFDLRTGESPACPSGDVCNLTPILAQLAPQDPNFGKGKCGPPCDASTACGTGLVCGAEGAVTSVMRCRLPPPECMGDIECPQSPATDSYGYCDLGSHACKSNCRTDVDCFAGYLCVNSACVAETCTQAGGADYACDYGQFCCGEDAGPAPCPTGVDAGTCYDHPANPWCQTCSKDDDCNNGSLPVRAGNRNFCFITSGQSGYCALGCDIGKPAECPRSWQCQNVFVGCQQDSDCGNQAGAHCKLPDAGTSDAGGDCSCNSSADCPTSGDETSTCRNGTCVWESVCHPTCP